MKLYRLLHAAEHRCDKPLITIGEGGDIVAAWCRNCGAAVHVETENRESGGSISPEEAREALAAAEKHPFPKPQPPVLNKSGGWPFDGCPHTPPCDTPAACRNKSGGSEPPPQPVNPRLCQDPSCEIKGPHMHVKIRPQ